MDVATDGTDYLPPELIELILVLTPAWQISFHGARGLPLFGLLPLVSRSQVEGGHHTTVQVATGMVLSIVFYSLGLDEA